ncbi:MAG: hypothetical protein M1823_005576, partial [Watsoniomyces obsoletus]
TPSRPGHIPLERTPKTLRQLQVQGQAMLTELDQEVTLDPSLIELKNRLVRFIKAAESSFAQAALQSRELADLRKAAQQRAVRASYRKTYLHNGGILRVDHALQLLEDKEAKEMEETEKKQRRAAAQAAQASRAEPGQRGQERGPPQQEQVERRAGEGSGGIGGPGNHSFDNSFMALPYSLRFGRRSHKRFVRTGDSSRVSTMLILDVKTDVYSNLIRK